MAGIEAGKMVEADLDEVSSGGLGEGHLPTHGVERFGDGGEAEKSGRVVHDLLVGAKADETDSKVFDESRRQRKMAG